MPIKPLKGKVLRPNAATLTRYNNQWQALITQMTRETSKELTALFKADKNNPAFDERIMLEIGMLTPTVVAMDASLADVAQGVINRLMAKFTVLFDRLADPLSSQMVQASNRDSEKGMQASLKELGERLTIKPNDKTKQIVDAAAQESAGLIKRTPQEYLPQIQGAVMRSITTGNGLADLVPALEKQEVKVKNWASNVAKDQTRKVFNTLNKERAVEAGAQEYEWIHAGGANKPRKYHLDPTPKGLNGRICRYDDPPVIDENTGERGIPGTLPYCGCTMRVIFRFDD